MEKIIFEIFSYDPLTGVIVYKQLFGNTRTVAIGDVAGTLGRKGYRHITCNGRRYRAHRIAWLIMTGNWPKNQVDHINGIRDDNRWCNLREATQSQNSMNQKIQNRNTTGYKGVTFSKSHNKYRAQIQIAGKKMRIGLYTTPEEAFEAYVNTANKLFKDFARCEHVRD